MERFGGPREVAEIGNSDKRSQLIEIHRDFPWRPRASL